MESTKIPNVKNYIVQRILGIAFGRVKKLSVLASGRHMRLLVPTISPAAPSTFLPQNCKPGNFHPDHKTYIFIGKTCMKFGVGSKIECQTRWLAAPWSEGGTIKPCSNLKLLGRRLIKSILSTDWQQSVTSRSRDVSVSRLLSLENLPSFVKDKIV